MFEFISSLFSRFFRAQNQHSSETPADSHPISECEEQHISKPVNQYMVDSLIQHFRQNAPLVDTQDASSDPRDDFAKFGGVDAELLTIDLMEGHDFEYWCATVLKDMDFDDVEVTPGSGDQGVDILAEKDFIKYAIQCKRYTADLGNTPVQEVHAGKAIYHCHVGVVITNRYFTRSAVELADATGVLLWDRDWIKRYLNQKFINDGALSIKHSKVPSVPVHDNSFETDDMLPAAISCVLETGTASISTLQRHLQLGYARAARLVDMMEDIGVVGPFRGSKPREIYLTKDEWYIVQNTISLPN